MKPVIVIAIAFVLLIPSNVFAQMGTGETPCMGNWVKSTNPNTPNDYVCVFENSDCQTTQDGCKLEISTDKVMYQPNETVIINLELIGETYFGDSVHNAEVKIIGSGGWTNLCFKIEREKCPDIDIRVNEPITFKFKPQRLAWEQEYKVHAKLGGFWTETLFTVVGTESKIVSDDGGGCLIATATYGSELAPQVQQLRELRDNQLLNTELGIQFMNHFNDFYYSFSPVIADYERENPMFREMVKVAITPMISSLSILNYVDTDSEESVLGYGISLIVLNAMMYVGIPIAGIITIRKRF